MPNFCLDCGERAGSSKRFRESVGSVILKAVRKKQGGAIKFFDKKDDGFAGFKAAPKAKGAVIPPELERKIWKETSKEAPEPFAHRLQATRMNPRAPEPGR